MVLWEEILSFRLPTMQLGRGKDHHPANEPPLYPQEIQMRTDLTATLDLDQQV